MANKIVTPEYQFGFGQKHGTPEQCHQVVKVTRNGLETRHNTAQLYFWMLDKHLIAIQIEITSTSTFLFSANVLHNASLLLRQDKQYFLRNL